MVSYRDGAPLLLPGLDNANSCITETVNCGTSIGVPSHNALSYPLKAWKGHCKQIGRQEQLAVIQLK